MSSPADEGPAAFGGAGGESGDRRAAGPVPAGRTRRAGRDTRGAILDAAAEELASTGRLTVNGVAARAGVSRQAVHHHVGGLRGLHAALRERGIEPPGGAGADTRERLLDAAARVLARRTGEATIDDIAAEAGVTKGAFYHYFPERAALLREVVPRISPVDELLVAVRATADLSDRDALAAIMRAYRDAMVRRAWLVQGIMSIRDPELLDAVGSEIFVRAAPILVAWWQDRVARGGLRPLPPTLVIQALFGPGLAEIVLGPVVISRLRALGGAPAAEVAEDYVDMLLRGIGAPPDDGAAIR